MWADDHTSSGDLMRFFSVLGQMAVERLRQRGLLGHERAAGEKDTRRNRRLDVVEEPMCESGRRYRSLVQNTSDIITLIDADGTVHYESSALEQVMGYRPEDQLGTRAFDWVHPDDMEQALSIFAEVLSTPGAPCAHRVQGPAQRRLLALSRTHHQQPA
jgi:PAS domain-containing protein